MQKYPKKRFYNTTKDISPSKEELHKLLTITSEINIINIAKIAEEGQVMAEIELDPLLIDRYFEIGFQCINLVEALNVAKAGWLILVDLIVAIEESEILQNNFETLFLLATQNLHHFDQQPIIAQFINICLFKVLFNKEATVKRLEYVNFPELSVSHFTSLISILKSLPLTNQELIQIDNKFFKHYQCFCCIVAYFLFICI